MSEYYGVDSLAPSGPILPVLEAAWRGTLPSWYGRYLESVSELELEALTGRGIHVLMIYNAGSGSLPMETTAQGVRDAKAAMQLSMRLCGMRKRPLIARDIEAGQLLTAEYALGWGMAFRNYDWPCAVYLPATQLPYAAAMNRVCSELPRLNRLVWTSQWSGYLPAYDQPKWGPDLVRLTDKGACVLWQFAGEALGLVDCSLATQEAYDLMLTGTGL